MAKLIRCFRVIFPRTTSSHLAHPLLTPFITTPILCFSTLLFTACGGISPTSPSSVPVVTSSTGPSVSVELVSSTPTQMVKGTPLTLSWVKVEASGEHIQYSFTSYTDSNKDLIVWAVAAGQAPKWLGSVDLGGSSPSSVILVGGGYIPEALELHVSSLDPNVPKGPSLGTFPLQRK